MNAWINFHAIWKIVVFGLVLGAGLPALFAIGVRLNAEGVGVAGDAAVVHRRHPLLLAISWAIFALVLALVIIAVLFIARDFIGHQLGVYILGAKRK